MSTPSLSSHHSHDDAVSEKGRADVSYTYGVGADDEIRGLLPSMRGRKLTAALAFVAGTGFTLFGYVAPPPAQGALQGQPV